MTSARDASCAAIAIASVIIDGEQFGCRSEYAEQHAVHGEVGGFGRAHTRCPSDRSEEYRILLESGRITAAGEGGEHSLDVVRMAMAV
jgi:hypothetical protein